MALPNKSLGQHWLKDEQILNYIADCADIKKDDSVLEIGPGPGFLTAKLLSRKINLFAVEIDSELAIKLEKQFLSNRFKLFNQDILDFDLNILPKDYTVVANIPYYITGKIINYLLNSNNLPKKIIILVQKEVAERIVATPPKMNLLGLNVAMFGSARLGEIIKSEKFYPPPKIDSQVVVIDISSKNKYSLPERNKIFKLAKIGFMNKRKKLLTSFSSGLNFSKEDIKNILFKNNISPDLRPQDLSLEDWSKLSKLLIK